MNPEIHSLTTIHTHCAGALGHPKGNLLVADVTRRRVVDGPRLQPRRLGGTYMVVGMLAWSLAPRAACHHLWRPVCCPRAQPMSSTVVFSAAVGTNHAIQRPCGLASHAGCVPYGVLVRASSLHSRDHEVAQLPAASEVPLLPK